MHLTALLNVDLVLVFNELGEYLEICIQVRELWANVDSVKDRDHLVLLLVLINPVIKKVFLIKWFKDELFLLVRPN